MDRFHWQNPPPIYAASDAKPFLELQPLDKRLAVEGRENLAPEQQAKEPRRKKALKYMCASYCGTRHSP